MKSEAEIRNHLRVLFLEEFNRRVQEARVRLPWSCVHNHTQPLDNRRMVEGAPNENYNRIATDRHLPVAQHIGLCMLGANSPDEWAGNICDEPIDAMRCPYFTPKRTKNDILSEFERQVSDRAWIQANMPEAAALYWALEASSTFTLPWWKRLWFWLTAVTPEAPEKKLELSSLLPERDDSVSP